MYDSHGQESPRRGVLGWIAAHPKTSISLCLLLLLISVTVLFDRAAQGRVARQIAALRAAGMPATLEDLQAAMPDVPDDQNMTIPILEQARILEAIKFTGDHYQQLPYIGSDRKAPSGRRLPAEQLEAARWYLDQASDALPIIHEALKLERGCVDVQWKSPALNILLPEVTYIRHMAKVLALESAVAAEDGDTRRAAEILLDSCRLERSLDGKPFVITALVRMAVHALARDRIERTINLCGLSDASLQRLQTELRGQEGADYYKQALFSERVIFIDTVRWLQSAPAGSMTGITGGGGFSTSSGFPIPVDAVWKFLPILPRLDEAAGIRFYNDLIQAVEDPDAASIQRVKAAESLITTLPMYCLVTHIMMPSFSRTTEVWVRSVGQNRALQAAIACERYRLATGGWPEALDALVPDYLAAVPVDPFDGKPMRYAQTDEGIKIWTISENLIDDGGDIGRLIVRRNSYRPKDAGWVLLNPDLRNRPAETEDD
jgi:hypothetical protein